MFHVEHLFSHLPLLQTIDSGASESPIWMVKD
jgi:hypothetical protein